MKYAIIAAIFLAVFLGGCTYQTQPSNPADMQARAAMIQAWPWPQPYHVPVYQMQTQQRMQTTCYRTGQMMNCY
jgi:PBP1b-binding outer membrane lipoprotein LpoB